MDVIEYVRNQYRDLTEGLWFLPALVSGTLIVGALAVAELDERAGWDGGGVLFGGSAEAARVVLSTIAGSVVTIVALTFSITIVVLQLAATQYTPRILRQFLGDRTTQLTAGYYVGVFVYCLLVLRTVRGSGVGGASFVPALSVTIAVLLAVGALVLLIVFIDNIARLIQVANVVPRIARDAADAARATRNGQGGSWLPIGTSAVVRAPRAGYVRRITPSDAAGRLPEGSWWVEAAVGTGSFVATVDAMAHVWPGERVDEARAAVEAAFAITNERDVMDDPAFGLRQLADIAIRALSPGVNDPTTAVMCIGYLRELAFQLSAGVGERLDHFDAPDLTFRIVEPPPEVLFEPLVEVGRHAIRDVRAAAEIIGAIGEVACRGGIPALRRASVELHAAAAAEARTASDVEYLERALATR